MENEFVVKKGDFFFHSRYLLSENYKAWYKFMESGMASSGFTDKALYYIHYKTGLMKKLAGVLHQITKVLYEPRLR